MRDYKDFYTNGEYLANNPTWDVEDSEWKASQLFALFKKNDIKDLKVVSEVGCGSGEVLYNFSKSLNNKDIKYYGFDISPQAIELAERIKKDKQLINFNYKISSEPDVKSDLILCVDVFEHIDDEFSFLKSIKDKSDYFLFNIPLDLSLQSLIRENTILSQRKRVGHINYYTKNLAIEILKDCSYEIIDYKYAEWFRFYKPDSISTRIINILRKILMKISPNLCVKLLGGSSLMVLAK